MSDQEPRTDKDSLIREKGGAPEERQGVKVMSAHSEGVGVKRLSQREPGELQTTVETAAQGDLTVEGKKNWTRDNGDS